MNEKDLRIFEEIVGACRRECYSSIDVASKIRSQAIVAMWEERWDLRRALLTLRQAGLFQHRHGEMQSLWDAKDTITAWLQ